MKIKETYSKNRFKNLKRGELVKWNSGLSDMKFGEGIWCGKRYIKNIKYLYGGRGYAYLHFDKRGYIDTYLSSIKVESMRKK